MNVTFILTNSIHEDCASSNLMRSYSGYHRNIFSYRCYCPAPDGIEAQGLIGNASYEYVLNINKNNRSIIIRFKNKILLYIAIIKDCIKSKKDNNSVYIYCLSSPLTIFIYSTIYHIKKVNTILYRTEIPYGLYKRPYLLFLYRILYFSINNLIVETYRMKYFYKRILKPSALINVVYSALDCDDIKNVKSINNTSKYIAFCGLISSEEKDGLLLAIEGFSKVLNYYSNLYFFIVGGIYNKTYYENLIKKVRNLGIKSKVFFTGSVPREQYIWYLKNAFLLVNCKKPEGYNSYGLSSKVIEYLYSGNPVLLTKSDEFQDLLLDMEDAIFIDYSSDSFSDKVTWALNNEKEARNIGKKGMIKASDLFSSEKMTSTLLSFIDKNK